MNVKRLPTFQREAFTLLELMCVIAIVSILAVIVLQANTGWKEPGGAGPCLSNLKSLYIGASTYMQQQGHWPQIDPRLVTNQAGIRAAMVRGAGAVRDFAASLGLPHESSASWAIPTNGPTNARAD